MADIVQTVAISRNSACRPETGCAVCSWRLTSAHRRLGSLTTRPTFATASFGSRIMRLNSAGPRAVSHMSPVHATRDRRHGPTDTPIPRVSQLTFSGARPSSNTQLNAVGLREHPYRKPFVGAVGSVSHQACRNCMLVARTSLM